LTNTTPALRATPPQLRKGVRAPQQFIHSFINCAYSPNRMASFTSLSPRPDKFTTAI